MPRRLLNIVFDVPEPFSLLLQGLDKVFLKDHEKNSEILNKILNISKMRFFALFLGRTLPEGT